MSRASTLDMDTGASTNRAAREGSLSNDQSERDAFRGLTHELCTLVLKKTTTDFFRSRMFPGRRQAQECISDSDVTQ